MCTNLISIKEVNIFGAGYVNKKDLVEPFANIIYLTVKNTDALKYKEENQGKIEQFYLWSKNYNWK